MYVYWNVAGSFDCGSFGSLAAARDRLRVMRRSDPTGTYRIVRVTRRSASEATTEREAAARRFAAAQLRELAKELRSCSRHTVAEMVEWRARELES